MTTQKQFMRDGKKFARAAQKPRAGQDIKSSSGTADITAMFAATSEKIVKYGMSHGFPQELATTCSRMYPRFEIEIICQAIRACDAQGCRNLDGFKNAMLTLARKVKK